MNLFSYMSLAATMSGLYSITGAAIALFNSTQYEGRPIGCYAHIYLHKHLEQSQDDYEDIMRKFPGRERHALHTDRQSNWATAFSRRFHSDTYLQESGERRRQQIEGMQKIVDTLNRKNIFDRVFIPPTEFRIEKLNHFPEYVACTDEIIIAYKPLPSVLNLNDGRCGSVVNISPPESEIQAQARIRWDLANRSVARKALDYLPSLPRPDEPQEAPQQPSGSTPRFLLASIWSCVSSVFALISRCFWYCLRALVR
jgi:hypothetical protein